ncbi:hypothetical protein M2T28_14280 [Elizabethkingia miricola]|uniref:hypothetical protein n=1 Tax=Elizabethkingia miricola TaxID=172045 RepID=UPI002018A184|nr:hypothetical protein [Elizabethkingia miricola]MCL1653788.1 hypothetical protein [Elizabethkingia miricola]
MNNNTIESNHQFDSFKYQEINKELNIIIHKFIFISETIENDINLNVCHKDEFDRLFKELLRSTGKITNYIDKHITKNKIIIKDDHLLKLTMHNNIIELGKILTNSNNNI